MSATQFETLLEANAGGPEISINFLEAMSKILDVTYHAAQ
jgi:hypothetical protein